MSEERDMSLSDCSTLINRLYKTIETLETDNKLYLRELAAKEQELAELRKRNEELKQSEYWDLIQVRGNLSIGPEQLKELRRDRERLDWLLNYIGSYETDDGKLIFWHACQYDTREDIDQAIRHSQENGEGEG